MTCTISDASWGQTKDWKILDFSLCPPVCTHLSHTHTVTHCSVTLSSQVASRWGSETALHIAGLHLASQETVPVFAVAEPNIPSTWTVPPSSIFRGNDWLGACALYPLVGLLLSVKVHVSQPRKRATPSQWCRSGTVSRCPKKILTRPWPCVVWL